MAICDVKVKEGRKKVRVSTLARPKAKNLAQSIAKTALAAIGSRKLEPEVKQRLDGYADEISTFIENTKERRDLGSRAVRLLETLAIRVAEFRLASIAGLEDLAHESAHEVSALCETIEVDLALSHSITEHIITKGRDQIYDPYRR